jgi:hypothetical protein
VAAAQAVGPVQAWKIWAWSVSVEADSEDADDGP